ncbi:MFS transporter [Cupriavidus sp. TMH.W2]|uniref:MFS transporter n=1 Tax=Cupriavidus sp. TMH.W2 TaxID=3434465 RepID=UPI003D789AFB
MHKLTRLTHRQLVSMGIPSLVTASMFVPFSFLIQPFYADTLGLGLVAVGQIIMFGRIFDVLIDPLVGWMSDHTRTRWGRRRPWMLASVPVLVAGIWLLFSPARPVTPVYLLGALMVFYVGVTAFLIPYHAWGAEISADYHERSRIVAVKMWMVAAGVPLTALIPSLLERVLHWDIAGQLQALSLLYVVMTPLTVACLLANVPEVGAAPPRKPRGLVAALKHYGYWLRQPDSMRLGALNSLIACSEAANTGLYVFFVTYSLRLDRWATSLLLVQTAVGLVSIPLWLAMTRKQGKSKALRTVLVVDTVVPLMALLIPAGHLAPLLGFVVARGLTWGAEYMILRSLLADQIYRHAMQTGDDSAGASYAVFQLTQKIAGAVAVGLIYGGLAWLGFDPAHGHLDADGLVRSAFAVLPAALSGVSLLLSAGLEPGVQAPTTASRK